MRESILIWVLQILEIRSTFRMAFFTHHLRAMCLTDRPEILDLEFGHNIEVNIKFST